MKVADGIYGEHGNDEKQGKATEPSHSSQDSHNSHGLKAKSEILPPRGDYQTLLSYQKSELDYRLTYRFCQRFLRRGDRTIGKTNDEKHGNF